MYQELSFLALLFSYISDIFLKFEWGLLEALFPTVKLFDHTRYNTKQDIDHIIDVFPGIVANLRRASPFWDSGKNEPRLDAKATMERPA